jgi:hypothetical protein
MANPGDLDLDRMKRVFFGAGRRLFHFDPGIARDRILQDPAVAEAFGLGGGSVDGDRGGSIAGGQIDFAGMPFGSWMEIVNVRFVFPIDQNGAAGRGDRALGEWVSSPV